MFGNVTNAADKLLHINKRISRAYLRLPRKPYQEEQEETTDHTGVKNYKTSRMHCQKPEQ